MGLFDGPPVTDAQRELVAMTDARTREWYLEAEITILNMRIADLEAALKTFADKAIYVDEIDYDFLVSVKAIDLRQARKVLGEKE
jgi:hypothetical protein